MIKVEEKSKFIYLDMSLVQCGFRLIKNQILQFCLSEVDFSIKGFSAQTIKILPVVNLLFPCAKLHAGI